MVSFAGVSNYIIQVIDSSNTIQIDGFVNDIGENLYLHQRVPIDFDNKDGYEILICSIVNKFEEELAHWLKNNVKRMVPIFFKGSYDFHNIWKHITSKVSIFQVIVLLSNLAFYHDLTCIIAMNNKNQATLTDQLTMFVDNIENHLRNFCDSIRSKGDRAYPKNSLMLQSQYVFLLRSHCDIVRRFIDCKVTGIDDFEFLALPKFSFEFPIKSVGTSEMFDATLRNYKKSIEEMNVPATFTEIDSQSEIFKTVDGMQALEGFDICMRCLNYKIPYGYELLPASASFVYTPLTQRCNLTLINAISTNIGAMVRGPHNVGKRSTVRALSTLVGKELFTFDCYGSNYEFLTQVFQGMVAGGFWVMFENVQNMEYGLLSSLCQIVSILVVYLFLTFIDYECATQDRIGPTARRPSADQHQPDA